MLGTMKVKNEGKVFLQKILPVSAGKFAKLPKRQVEIFL
jgi:hypothetical protein